MEGLYDTQEPLQTSDPLKDEVEGLDEVNKGDIQRLVLLSKFLLKLM